MSAATRVLSLASPAASPPVEVSPARRRRLSAAMPLARPQRHLTQTIPDPSTLDWLDIQTDGAVNTLDSNAFFFIRSSFADIDDLTKYCTIIGDLYSPSISNTEDLEESFTDASFVDQESPAWFAMDLSLIHI